MSTARKVRAFAEGAAVGGVINAAAVAAIHYGMKGLTRVAPTAARVVVTATSLPALATAAAVGATYGGVQSFRRGDSAGRVVGNVVMGAASLGTNVIADVISSPAAAQTTKPQTSLDHLKGNYPSIEARLEQRIRDAEQMKKPPAGTKARQDWELRQREVAALKKELAAERAKQAQTPAPSAPEPSKGLLQQAREAVFGVSGPKAEDALALQRRQLEQTAAETRARLDTEFRQRGGKGPKYDGLKTELDQIQGRLNELTKQQADKEAAETALYRQAGGLIAGAVVGGLLGRLTYNKAKAAADAAAKGIERLANRSGKLVDKLPKGVIAGTVSGDKAGAAVLVARDALSKPQVTAVEAYGLPALNVAHGAAGYYVGKRDPDSPISGALMAEGAAAIAAGAIGAKFGMAARAVRPIVSPDLAGKLKSASLRLSREVRKGPAAVAVAQAKGRAEIAKSSAKGAVSRAEIGRRAADAAARVDGKRRVADTTARAEAAAAKGRAATAKTKATTSAATDIARARGQRDVAKAKVGKVEAERALARASKGRALAGANKKLDAARSGKVIATDGVTESYTATRTVRTRGGASRRVQVRVNAYATPQRAVR